MPILEYAHDTFSTQQTILISQRTTTMPTKSKKTSAAVLAKKTRGKGATAEAKGNVADALAANKENNNNVASDEDSPGKKTIAPSTPKARLQGIDCNVDGGDEATAAPVVTINHNPRPGKDLNKLLEWHRKNTTSNPATRSSKKKRDEDLQKIDKEVNDLIHAFEELNVDSIIAAAEQLPDPPIDLLAGAGDILFYRTEYL